MIVNLTSVGPKCRFVRPLNNYLFQYQTRQLKRRISYRSMHPPHQLPLVIHRREQRYQLQGFLKSESVGKYPRKRSQRLSKLPAQKDILGRLNTHSCSIHTRINLENQRLLLLKFKHLFWWRTYSKRDHPRSRTGASLASILVILGILIRLTLVPIQLFLLLLPWIRCLIFSRYRMIVAVKVSIHHGPRSMG